MERGGVGPHAVNDEDDSLQSACGPQQRYSGKYKDDITKRVLNDKLVMAARATELQYFNSKGIWRKRLRQEAFARTGRQPISVRWRERKQRR